MKKDHGRISIERGRKIWLLVTSGGKVIDDFRTKTMAERYRKFYLKEYGWGLEIKRREVKDEHKERVSKL